MPAQAKKAGPKAHKMAEQFPKGSVLKDLFKKEWVLEDVVGQGGFGLIYLASEKDSKSDHVIKIEPKNNGPLFCEMQYYQRVAKADLIKSFTTSHKLQYLALPPFMGTGSYEFKKVDYRFLVMPRLGTDLQKLLVESGGTFRPEVVFSVGLRVLDALQFMHSNEYVHADVKAANILQGYKQGKCVTTQVYLVDYGLAYRYVVDGVHKPYKEDPRKAHDGTIEFTSRDAHKGVSPSRRADLEILGYCLLQWLCGKLPWENKLGDPQYVATGKEKLMSNVSTAVPSCFKDNSNSNSAHSATMTKFLSHVSSLKYDQAPDYNKIKGWLREGLTKAGVKDEWKVEVTAMSKQTESEDYPTEREPFSSAFNPLTWLQFNQGKPDPLATHTQPPHTPISQMESEDSPLEKALFSTAVNPLSWLQSNLGKPTNTYEGTTHNHATTTHTQLSQMESEDSHPEKALFSTAVNPLSWLRSNLGKPTNTCEGTTHNHATTTHTPLSQMESKESPPEKASFSSDVNPLSWLQSNLGKPTNTYEPTPHNQAPVYLTPYSQLSLDARNINLFLTKSRK